KILKEGRERKRKLAETVGSDDRETLALRQQYAMQHLAYLQKELMEVQSQKRRADAELKTKVRADDVTETPSTSYTQADIDALIDQDASISRLLVQLEADEERLNRHKAQVHAMSRNAGGDPTVKKLRDNVAATRDLIRKRRAEMRPIVIRHLEKQGAAKQVI